MNFRRAIAALALLGAATLAAAGPYPAKPIKLIVPFPPGGGTDILGRTVANQLSVADQWTVVIENRPGAAGNIGVEAAAKSPADGYTIVMGQTSNLAISPSLYSHLPYDPVKDFEPIVLVGSGPIAIVVRADSPYKTLADLIAAAKAKPGMMMMATPGNGTVAHLAGVRLQKIAGVKFEHIPYKGAANAIPDLVGGRVDLFLSSVPTIESQVASGQLRALAVTSAKRSSVLPNVPTVGETMKGFQADTWFGLLAPAGTPKPIVDKLNAEINKALQAPAVRKTIERDGGEVLGGTPDEFAKLIKSELASWGPIVRESGAKVD